MRGGCSTKSIYDAYELNIVDIKSEDSYNVLEARANILELRPYFILQVGGMW